MFDFSIMGIFALLINFRWRVEGGKRKVDDANLNRWWGAEGGG